ncbi:MAG: hypothetical protein EOP05_07520 [Proteobacteria bacterium]|nr:MAG: hypothetical protein EOP05_07520 [Pseudomonadota bacterium]
MKTSIKNLANNVATRMGLTLAVSCAVLPAFGAPSQLESSKQFHGLLSQTLSPEAKKAESTGIHYMMNQPLDGLMSANSIEEAMKMVRLSIDSIMFDSRAAGATQAPSLDKALAKAPLTVVVVPGVFAEFIKVRAFEGAFAPTSAYAKQFAQVIAKASAQKNAAAFDVTFDSSKLQKTTVSLADVVSVGSLDDAKGNPQVKVIIFKTPFLSLESVGDQEQQAALFTRRLEKYLALTGAQNLAFVGYSRGTATGLSMLSDAQKKSKPWLKNVKAMVSYAGVVSGSALADDLDNPEAPLAKMVALLKTLRKELRVPRTNDQMNVLQKARENLVVAKNNNDAWLKFSAKALLVAPKLIPSNNSPDIKELDGSPTDVDISSPFALTLKMYGAMGLKNPITSYGANVERFQLLIDANLMAVEQLRTVVRKQWWKTHFVPTEGLTYYSITAAMADPARSEFEKAVFLAPFGYSRSYDDKSLLQNHRDYTRVSGVTLNDSQVSVAQAMFLPGVIRSMNPYQAPLKITNLGVMSTHHWGMALQVVSEMKDKRLNPFPREAVLKALAGQIVLDQGL